MQRPNNRKAKLTGQYGKRQRQKINTAYIKAGGIDGASPYTGEGQKRIIEFVPNG